MPSRQEHAADADHPGRVDHGAEPARFRWPPAAGASERAVVDATAAHSPESKPPPPDTPRAWQLREIVLEAERAWLGLVTPPIDIRLRDAGWRPEPRDASCWRCGASIGPHASDDRGCPDCRAQGLPWERLVRLGRFDGVLRDMVHEVKFTRWRELGVDLGRLLGERLRDELARVAIDPADVVVVPMPMSFWRRLARGVDHARAIASGVGEAIGAPVVSALGRDHRPPQWSVAPSQRGANVAGSVWVRSRGAVAGKLAVVVDDVTTTRSTVRTACRALAESSDVRKLNGSASGRPRRGAAASTLDQSAGAGIRVWVAVVAVAEAGR